MSANIETIARGVALRDSRILLCRAKGGKSTYLPGGHIEFGETGREALAREMKEETALDFSVGRFLGALENSFMQNGERHCEINLVYEMSCDATEDCVASAEDWIEFEWCELDKLDEANLLPEGFRRLRTNPNATFEP